jgi:hypothetical protein
MLENYICRYVGLTFEKIEWIAIEFNLHRNLVEVHFYSLHINLELKSRLILKYGSLYKILI